MIDLAGYRKFIFFCSFLFCYSYAAAQTLYQVRDDSGQLWQFTHPVRRIISLAPNITELLFAAGAGKYVVAVSSYSNYPAAAKKLPVVADYNQLDIERIIALKPDIIIAWQKGNSPQQLAILQHLGEKVYFCGPQTIPDIARTLQNFGVLARTSSTANDVAQTFMQRYEQLKKQYSQQNKVTVFYEVAQQPLMTSNHHSLIDQVIELCGGQNIFANLLENWPVISLGAVLKADPQVIILTPPVTDDWQSFWLPWKNLHAVKNGYIFAINPDIVTRFGPRLLEGAAQICEDIAKARIKIN